MINQWECLPSNPKCDPLASKVLANLEDMITQGDGALEQDVLWKFVPKGHY